MLGKIYHMKKDQCLLAHFKIPSYWQAGIEKSLWKLLGGDSCPAQNFWASHLQWRYSLPLELERLNWLSKGAKALEQISQRTGEQEAGAEGASPPAGAGFVTLQLLLSQPGVPTSADNPTQEASATEATRTLSWRTVCKREFLICGKLQHSEICFSSTYKQEAKIPWSVWNGSPGEERGQGMKEIKKPSFEEKKISCWYCFGELCHFLTFMGTKLDPSSSSQGIWERCMKNEQTMISQKPPDKEVIFRLVIHKFNIFRELYNSSQSPTRHFSTDFNFKICILTENIYSSTCS